MAKCCNFQANSFFTGIAVDEALLAQFNKKFICNTITHYIEFSSSFFWKVNPFLWIWVIVYFFPSSRNSSIKRRYPWNTLLFSLESTMPCRLNYSGNAKKRVLIMLCGLVLWCIAAKLKVIHNTLSLNLRSV